MDADQTEKPQKAAGREFEFTTEEKVAFLSNREAYRHCPSDVFAEETHMSWVFLAGNRVYKLKKPVAYAFLDFSTIERRGINCREEVRLNRRLAPDVYLGVVALVTDGRGGLLLGGAGQIVDWLVEMRRLPADRMLDKLIAARGVSEGAIGAVADRLIDFYRYCDRAKLNGREYIAQLAHEHEINRAIITNPRLELDQAKVGRALAGVEHHIYHFPNLLSDRASCARIVEGHGDLRPEHICLEDRPVIIDCLEFNRRLRLVDPVDEIAFLGLECARLDAAWIGRTILRRYSEKSGDRAGAELARFYWTYRACLRARLSLVHIIEGDKRKPEKWLPLARLYIELASAPSII